MWYLKHTLLPVRASLLHKLWAVHPYHPRPSLSSLIGSLLPLHANHPILFSWPFRIPHALAPRQQVQQQNKENG
ncbi:hypothetical protein HDK77DRAFT_255358 [Phyllosticta capitalensis]